jgi:HEAT repeat protein
MRELLAGIDSVRSPLLASDALLAIAVGVLGLTAVVIVLALTVFGHHIYSDNERRRNRERFEAAASFLAPFLVADDKHLMNHVFQARSRFGDRAVSLVLRRSRYDIRGESSAAITAALTEMGAVARLIDEYKSKRDWKRAAAVRGLGECGGEEARQVLIQASRDTSGEVRRGAREGLLIDGTGESIQIAIASFLEDLPRRAGWRKSFYARLASISPHELIELVKSQKLQPTEEKLALEALGDTNAHDALPLAIERVNSADAETRATAARVVGKLGSASEIRLLNDALNDDAWFVRAAAARALEWMLGTRGMGKTNPSEAASSMSALGSRLLDNSWWVRANAARALSYGGAHGIEILFRASEGEDAYARDASLAALAMANLEPSARERLQLVVDRLLLAKPLEKPKGPRAIDFGLGATT